MDMSARLPNPFAPKRSDRIAAQATCAAREWVPGMVLKSRAWRFKRRIVRIKDGFVDLAHAEGDSANKFMAVEWFPKDVERVA